MKIFFGTNYYHLAFNIKENADNFKIGNLQIDKFSDGEILPCFKESIRDIDVFFINSSDSSESIMETLLVVDAAKRAGCKSFTLVSPYSGYSRQDKTDHLRSSIGSKLLADIFEKAGVNRLITIDLHSSSIQGFYNIPVIHLNGNVISIDYIKSLGLDNLCIVAPDQGAAKRAGCKSFTLVSPYSGYSRQDKTDHLRSSIGSKLLADIFEKAGVNRLITIDLHSSSIQGFYNFPVIHLNGNVISIDYIKSLDLDNLCIVAPDQGAVKRASDFCKAFPEATFALVNKKRIKPNEIHSMELVGDVDGKNVIIVDDMADTLGTMAKACELLLERGALSVRCVATHGILSGKALENLYNSKIEEVIVIDTLHSVYDKAKLNSRIKIISCAKLIAKSISALIEKKSIHEINNV